MMRILDLPLVTLVDMQGKPRDESGENISLMFSYRLQKNNLPINMFVKLRLHRTNKQPSLGTIFFLLFFNNDNKIFFFF